MVRTTNRLDYRRGYLVGLRHPANHRPTTKSGPVQTWLQRNQRPRDHRRWLLVTPYAAKLQDTTVAGLVRSTNCQASQRPQRLQRMLATNPELLCGTPYSLQLAGADAGL